MRCQQLSTEIALRGNRDGNIPRSKVVQIKLAHSIAQIFYMRRSICNLKSVIRNLKSNFKNLRKVSSHDVRYIKIVLADNYRG